MSEPVGVSKPKFAFGDYIFAASLSAATEWVTCPECEGKRYIRLKYNDEEYTCDCERCNRGYLGSTGHIEHCTYAPLVREGTIDGVSKDSSEPLVYEYRLSAGGNSYWIIKEQDTFATKEEAEARAEELKAQQQKEEEERIQKKYKPTKSWAWHVQYYKRQIASAQKQIEFATLQLNAAKKHAKEQS